MFGINLGRYLGERFAKLTPAGKLSETSNPVFAKARKTFGTRLHGVRGDIAIFDSKKGKATEFAKLGEDGLFHHLKTKYIYDPITKKKGRTLCTRYDEIETQTRDGDNVIKTRFLERLYDGGKNLIKHIKRISYYAQGDKKGSAPVKVNGFSYLEYDYLNRTFQKMISSTGNHNGRTAIESGVLSLNNGNIVPRIKQRTILHDNL